ncbi:MAG: DUF4331 family protein [Oculatellaceae cyanobacterium bins.114]|nr:DUF4331 family protein [Oculatellaceae cyanobacterium bins.114]
MSHHFNSPTAKVDGRLNLTDLYVFPASAASTVFVINSGPDAGSGKSSPEAFHPDATYDLNIDLDGDLKEDLRYRLRSSADGSWTLSEQQGWSAPREEPGIAIAQADRLEKIVHLETGGRVWAGLIADPFVANVVGYFGFMESIAKGQPDYSFFQQPNNKFEGRDVMSIVLELPNERLGGNSNLIRVWGTITGLEPDGGYQQVSRWGMPLAAFMIAGKPGEFDAFNSAHPFDWTTHEREHAVEYLTQVVSTTSAIADAKTYAERVTDTYVIPVAMPYQVGTVAAFSMNGVNGRSLTDNVYDVLMTRITNRPISAGVDPQLPRATFPYVNAPHRRSDIPPVIDRSQA